MKQIEHEHQCALFKWAELNTSRIPELKMLFAIPNGGKRSKITAARLKKEGVKAGVPDTAMMVVKWGIGNDIEFAGLFIELKKPKGAKPTDTQLQWHEDLRLNGYQVSVCYGWESARDVILEYLGKS